MCTNGQLDNTDGVLAPYSMHIGGIVMYRVDKATFQVLFGSRSPGMPAYVDDPVISTKEIADDD